MESTVARHHVYQQRDVILGRARLVFSRQYSPGCTEAFEERRDEKGAASVHTTRRVECQIGSRPPSPAPLQGEQAVARPFPPRRREGAGPGMAHIARGIS